MAVVDVERTETPTRSDARAAVFAVGCYVFARLLIVSTVDPATTNDTPGYVDIDLLGGAQRPWVYPAVRRLFDDGTFVYVQAFVSAVAFVVLAAAIATTLRTVHARVFVLALIPLLGTTQRITTWDAVIATESLAVSLTALGIAAAVRWRSLPTWAIISLCVAWTFVRDAHLLLAAPIALVVAVAAWRERRRALAGLVVIVAVWAFGAAQNNRWVESYNVTANIAWHVLDPSDGSSAERVDWFIDHGMPDSPALDDPEWITALRGLQADQVFQAWAADDGVPVYVRYLVEHPGVMLGALPAIVGGDESMVDQTPHRYAETPRFPFNLVWPNEGSLFTIVLVGVAFGAATWLSRGGAVTLPIVLLASTIPHAFLVYHGAPRELARHAMLLTFVLVVACWWLVAAAADQIPHLEIRNVSCAWRSPVDRTESHTRISQMSMFMYRLTVLRRSAPSAIRSTVGDSVVPRSASSEPPSSHKDPPPEPIW